MGIKLSFCIPTYNFGSFLGEALEGIISQAGPEVEIVIVDGASTDNTRQVVAEFQNEFRDIHYYLRDKRGGVDTDMALAVELARGEYCWLMSADDRLKPQAIKRILKEIESGYDIYLCNRTECDFSLRPRKERFWLDKRVGDRVFDFSYRPDLLDYLNKARSIGALFSYCSSIVFSRQKWSLLAQEEKFIGTGYAHVNRLFSLRAQGCRLKYIRQPLVFCRGDNDSFLCQGKLKRFLMDLEGFCMLAECLFPEDVELKKAFMKIMTREMRPHYLMEMRSLMRDEVEWRQIRNRLVDFGFNDSLLRLVESIGASKTVVSLASRLKEAIKKRR